MKLSEQIDVEYDKADALSGRCDIPRDTLLGWKNETVQLEAENERLKKALLVPLDESDYCYVCRNHGGSSHPKDCPMHALLTRE